LRKYLLGNRITLLLPGGILLISISTPLFQQVYYLLDPFANCRGVFVQSGSLTPHFFGSTLSISFKSSFAGLRFALAIQIKGFLYPPLLF